MVYSLGVARAHLKFMRISDVIILFFDWDLGRLAITYSMVHLWYGTNLMLHNLDISSNFDPIQMVVRIQIVSRHK